MKEYIKTPSEGLHTWKVFPSAQILMMSTHPPSVVSREPRQEGCSPCVTHRVPGLELPARRSCGGVLNASVNKYLIILKATRNNANYTCIPLECPMFRPEDRCVPVGRTSHPLGLSLVAFHVQKRTPLSASTTLIFQILSCLVTITTPESPGGSPLGLPSQARVVNVKNRNQSLFEATHSNRLKVIPSLELLSYSG